LRCSLDVIEFLYEATGENGLLLLLVWLLLIKFSWSIWILWKTF